MPWHDYGRSRMFFPSPPPPSAHSPPPMLACATSRGAPAQRRPAQSRDLAAREASSLQHQHLPGHHQPLSPRRHQRQFPLHPHPTPHPTPLPDSCPSIWRTFCVSFWREPHTAARPRSTSQLNGRRRSRIFRSTPRGSADAGNASATLGSAAHKSSRLEV